MKMTGLWIRGPGGDPIWVKVVSFVTRDLNQEKKEHSKADSFMVKLS